MVVDAQGLAELGDGGCVLVAGREHAEGHFDTLGVGGIDHGRVDFGDGGEGGAGLGGQGDDLDGGISRLRFSKLLLGMGGSL